MAMTTSALKKIERALNELKDPHIYGWSFYPYIRGISEEYENLNEDERRKIRSSLILPRLASQDEKELSAALNFCSRIPTPESKKVLLDLLQDEKIRKNRWLLHDLLLALGQLKIADALNDFRYFAKFSSDQDSDKSRIAVAAILAIAFVDFNEALTHLSMIAQGDLRYRKDLEDSGIGYTNSEVLLRELLLRFGKDENKRNLILGMILQSSSEARIFVKKVLDLIEKRSKKILLEFKTKMPSKLLDEENAIATLAFHIKQQL